MLKHPGGYTKRPWSVRGNTRHFLVFSHEHSYYDAPITDGACLPAVPYHGCTTTTRAAAVLRLLQHSPVGAIVLMVAGVAYLMSKDGSYSKKTTSSSGTVVYQSVPAPVGASIKTLPAERVLVTVSGTTYYLYSNAFYRKVMNGAQETFVTVTPPPGPCSFGAARRLRGRPLNTMYFNANGNFYVPFLAGDGKELFAMVARPPAPPAGAAAPPAASAAPAAAPAPAPAVRAVAESMVVPTGTQLVVRLATEVNSATASVGDRFQGFLDLDLAADGRLVAPRGGAVYGVVTAVERGSKSGKEPSLSVMLSDMKVGDRIVSIKTQPISKKGEASKGNAKSSVAQCSARQSAESPAEERGPRSAQRSGRVPGPSRHRLARSRGRPSRRRLRRRSRWPCRSRWTS